jgi:phage/plasmid-associated DNA primase
MIFETEELTFCEYVNPSKLQELLTSNTLRNEWTEKNKKQHHKNYVVRNFDNERHQLECYLRDQINGLLKIQYYKKKLQGRFQFGNCATTMRRKLRNYCLKDDYYDFDMVNSCFSILRMLGQKHKELFNYSEFRYIDEYCDNRQEWTNGLMKELNKTKEEVKTLLIAVNFGGEYKDYTGKGYSKKLQNISYNMNKNIGKILKQTGLYDEIKTEKNTMGSWIANLVQSIEANIVVGLLRHIVNNYPLLVRNPFNTFEELLIAIYELDGFKLLKQNVDEFSGPDAVIGIINEWLIENMYNTAENQYIQFINKPMDEVMDLDADEISFNQLKDTPQSNTLSPSPVEINTTFSPIIITPTPTPTPTNIKITIEDLEKGERFIADLIFPLFANHIKYYEISVDAKCIKYWYSLNEKNLWVQSIEPPRKKIITKLQELIEIEKNEVWELYKKETDEKEKKILGKLEETLGKYYSNVGKHSYSTTLCCDYLCYNLQDNSFPKKINNTIGKLVFNDGILNLKTGIFKAGFEQSDYITSDALLNHNYLELQPNETKMNYLKNEFKKICNNSDADFEYTFSIIGYSFTGDAELEKSIYYLVDGTEDKRGDNGKTFIFSICGELFPELVKLSDPEMLEEKYTKAYKHIATWKNKRIVYFDEGTKKKLNSKLVKKIGDGKFISNEIMFGCVEEIKVYFKMFVCSNHIPKIGNDEEAVFNRYIQLEFGSHFDRTGERVEDNPSKLEFIADPRLSQKIISEYKDEFITMIINYAKKYYQKGLPPIPTKFIEATKQTKISNNEFSKWFFETYEAGTNENTIGLDNLIGNYTTQISREDAIKELKKIRITFNKDLTGFGTKINDKGKKVYIKGGIVGWKMKQKEEEEEVK